MQLWFIVLVLSRLLGGGESPASATTAGVSAGNGQVHVMDGSPLPIPNSSNMSAVDGQFHVMEGTPLPPPKGR